VTKGGGNDLSPYATEEKEQKETEGSPGTTVKGGEPSWLSPERATVSRLGAATESGRVHDHKAEGGSQGIPGWTRQGPGKVSRFRSVKEVHGRRKVEKRPRDRIGSSPNLFGEWRVTGRFHTASLK